MPYTRAAVTVERVDGFDGLQPDMDPLDRRPGRRAGARHVRTVHRHRLGRPTQQLRAVRVDLIAGALGAAAERTAGIGEHLAAVAAM